MRCPNCGRYCKEIRVKEDGGKVATYADCAYCGRVLVRSWSQNFNRILVPAVILIFGFAAIFFFYQAFTTQSTLRDKELVFSILSDDYANLEGDYYELLDSMSVLNDYYNNLTVMFSDLGENFTNLRDRYDSLVGEYDSLQEMYFNFNLDYIDLQNMYLAQVNHSKTLEKKYDNLTFEFDRFKNLQKVDILQKDYLIEISEGGHETITYESLYAGYIIVNFTSSIDVFFWIGSSVTDGGYYSRYPAFPYTSINGTFIAPVCETTYLYIENTSSDVVAVITLSVKHVY